ARAVEPAGELVRLGPGVSRAVRARQGGGVQQDAARPLAQIKGHPAHRSYSAARMVGTLRGVGRILRNSPERQCRLLRGGCNEALSLLQKPTAAAAAPGSKVLPEHRKKCLKWSLVP